LQTLETLARGQWLTDAGFRAHIAAEAAWLRALVEGVDMERESDLLTALHLLVQRKAKIGLQVEWNNTQLREGGRWRYTLRPEMIAAIVDATGEALTNVEKHAGVDTAVVRASVGERELTVSVLDHGCGFDLALVHRGVGLDTSIRARIAEQGGRVRIESAPGAGTYLEIVLPLGTTEECGTHEGHDDTVLPT
jgi:signal transduction histidine kinase